MRSSLAIIVNCYRVIEELERLALLKYGADERLGDMENRGLKKNMIQ